MTTTLVRLLCFLGVLVLMCLWEHCAPFRDPQPRPYRRWLSHGGLLAIGTAVMRLVPGFSALAVASINRWGLCHQLALPEWLGILLTVVVLDLAVYGHHVVFHRYPPLWRIHQVHHADLHFDTTTGLRFHPLELLLSMLWKMIVVALLGSPVLGVLIYEVALNATALFNHGNVRLPGILESLLRPVVVTPDWHRVHHSSRLEDTNSNYGSIFSWWDRLFGTYRATAQGSTIGLEHYRDPQQTQQLGWMLMLPFLPLPQKHCSEP
ncbi:MAG: sterol desaturase family protein [Thermostichales cyanobacterium BF4_bins_65]